MPNSGWIGLADRAGGQLAVGQQLEDPPPHRVAEDVERFHAAMYQYLLILVKTQTSRERTGRSEPDRGLECGAHGVLEQARARRSRRPRR